MTAYRVRGRLLKLGHVLQPTKPERMPAALRHARIVALLLKSGAVCTAVEAERMLPALLAMTPEARQAWIRVGRARFKE